MDSLASRGDFYQKQTIAHFQVYHSIFNFDLAPACFSHTLDGVEWSCGRNCYLGKPIAVLYCILKASVYETIMVVVENR